MKRIRFLYVRFKGELKNFEVPAFRGAVIKKVGRSEDLFHNHTEDGGNIFRYPMIQYKIVKKQPAIVCIEEGVDELYKVFSAPNQEMLIGERKLKIEVEQLDLKTITIQCWENTFLYRINKWLPLNQDSFREYINIEKSDDKRVFLEKKLIGNIISMAKGIEWTVDKEIKLKIVELKDPFKITFKGVTVFSFDIEFETNVSLPQYIGIGKGAGLGHGIITKRLN